MNILDIIVHHKKREVAKRKSLYPLAMLQESIYYDTTPLSLKQYLKRNDKSGVIAEFKRRSPSKPEINIYADPESISIGYMQSGASALSILTDEEYFGGKSEDLSTARKFNYCPILRKDFIIGNYQIHEAKSIGADAILLIAEILTQEQVAGLSATAKELGLEVLLEMHDASQINKITRNIDIVGVNNRDLKTFKTNVKSSLDIIKELPDDICKISESGIHYAEQMIELSNAGFDGFLIGEKFMASPDPIAACAQLINDYNQLKNGVEV